MCILTTGNTVQLKCSFYVVDQVWALIYLLFGMTKLQIWKWFMDHTISPKYQQPHDQLLADHSFTMVE